MITLSFTQQQEETQEATQKIIFLKVHFHSINYVIHLRRESDQEEPMNHLAYLVIKSPDTHKINPIFIYACAYSFIASF